MKGKVAKGKAFRRALGVLTACLILGSCGGSGTGESSQGFYRFSASVVEANTSTCSVYYDLNDDGTVRDYEITPDENFITVLLAKAYTTANPPANPLPLYLKEAVVSIGNFREVIPLTGEVGEEGIEVSVPLTVGAKILSPIIYSNDLEDQRFTWIESQELAGEEDFWEEGSSTGVYDGSAPVVLADLGRPVKEVELRVEDNLCPIGDDGSLGYPCSGSVDFTNGTIKVSVDSSLLTQEHAQTLTYSPSTSPTQSFVLTPGIEAGTINLVNQDYGIEVRDDGGGNLYWGDLKVGSVNYDAGSLTLSIPEDSLPAQKEEKEASSYFGYAESGQYQLEPDLKPLTVRFTAIDSTPDDPNAQGVGYCTDDGNGNLVGDCTGTVDYETGVVSYQWNAAVSDAGAKSVYAERVYYETTYPDFDFAASWKSLDSTAQITATYKALKTQYPTTFTLSLPPETEFTSLTLYDGAERFSDYSYEVAGSTVSVHLNSPPDSDLTAVVEAERRFDFNPSVFVYSPRPVVVSGEVKFVAVLGDGEELTATVPFTVSARSCGFDLETATTTTIE